jgi:hypothetical protein
MEPKRAGGNPLAQLQPSVAGAMTFNSSETVSEFRSNLVPQGSAADGSFHSCLQQAGGVRADKPGAERARGRGREERNPSAVELVSRDFP